MNARMVDKSGTGGLKLFVFGTLKRGFPLHQRAMGGARFLGRYCSLERFPMLVAGPWYAPMLLNQPGLGLQIKGELYEIDDALLPSLDALESVGKPGNLRIEIEIVSLETGSRCSAFAYAKSAELAQPVHSEYLEEYLDRRFVPPEERYPFQEVQDQIRPTASI